MNFFCKLLPPRPSFAHDMPPEEQALMQQHAGYWQEWIGRGHVIAFGFVADPAGPFGMGIVSFESEAEVRAFTDGDPTILAAAGFRFEVHPMGDGLIPRSSANPRVTGSISTRRCVARTDCPVGAEVGARTCIPSPFTL